jgi:hypothetical protein
LISSILKKYQKLIVSYEVKKFHQVANSYALIIEFNLIDNHKYIAKDYLFLDGSRKYAFHFQDEKEKMIFRFDNAPHWTTISTFPYHKHADNKIVESRPMNIDKVFIEIEKYFDAK